MAGAPVINAILYATDLDKPMRPVFRRAIQLARVHQGRIIMLHVMEPLSGTGQAIIDAYMTSKTHVRMQHDGMQKILQRMRERIAKFCEEELGEGPDSSPLVSDVVVHLGRAGDEIPLQAEQQQADMIVMGTCPHAVCSARPRREWFRSAGFRRWWRPTATVESPTTTPALARHIRCIRLWRRSCPALPASGNLAALHKFSAFGAQRGHGDSVPGLLSSPGDI